MSEDQLQSKCYMWFHNSYPELRKTLFAVPNGGHRSKREANKFKATGVVRGVHDLLFLHKGKLYTLELKVDSNKLSPDQIEFWDAIEKQGGKCYEIRTLEYFKEIINDIVNA